MTAYERVGADTIHTVIDRFVDRMFEDFVIGFLFQGKDRARVKQHEFEHAARVLGGDIPYLGRNIPELHRPLRINGGQFRRRLALLRQELERAGVPDDIRAVWLEAQQRMQKMITDGTDCGAPDVPGR
jgi:truncated hemoglobin YjbI